MSVSDACTSAIGLGRAKLARSVRPSTGVGRRLHLADASARDRAVRGRLSTLQMLPAGDSYFTLLTNISEPCGSTGVAGDLSGCGRSLRARGDA